MSLSPHALVEKCTSPVPPPVPISEDDLRLMAESPEAVMEEIRVRATEIGSVLEGILREDHGNSHWGLNE